MKFKLLRKAMFIIFLLLMIAPSFKLKAEVSLTPLIKADGKGYVTYRGTTTQVMIPTSYTQQTSEFRAVWVSPLVDDISSYTNDDLFKNELTSVLNVIESFKMNAIVFHVRIMHDALYDSDLNIKSNYISGADFSRWDYLEWFISEAHRRGIEFHAWLNPYRISSSDTSLQFITSKYAKFPQNPAAKAENIIIASKGAILNPGEPKVRDFIVASCMEIIQKYDVDAIHFDDYFYASMPANADLATYNKYKSTSSTTNISDWRREQIDLFLEQLSKTMRNYNLEANRYVQLGIAPTGIWRNGDGKVTYDSQGTAITNGSNTAGQEHYASYLYCNTKKWVDEEWIDYIIPQSYWSFELPAAPYADVVDWWAKVVRYKAVNLYTGMGFYRIYSGDSGGSWETNLYEAANQVLYNTKDEMIKGLCIFNYKYLKSAKTNPGMAKVLNEYWLNPVKTPLIKTMKPLLPAQVENILINKIGEQDYVLSWHPSENASKYLIYASEGIIDYDEPNQVVGMVGVNQNNKCLFATSALKKMNYALVAVSNTGHMSAPSTISTSDAKGDFNQVIAKLDIPSLKTPVFPQAKMQINFSVADIYLGKAMNYVVYTSLDNINWTVAEGRFRQYNNYYSFQFTYPDSLACLYLKVIGTNEYGSVTSPTLQLGLQVAKPSELLNLAKLLLTEALSAMGLE